MFNPISDISLPKLLGYRKGAKGRGLVRGRVEKSWNHIFESIGVGWGFQGVQARIQHWRKFQPSSGAAKIKLDAA